MYVNIIILGAIPSGSLGLVQFKISIWSFTSSSVIKKSGQVFTGLIFSVGRSGSSSICKTINDNYSNFLSTINRVCDKHIPSKVVVIRPDDKPFMNNSIRTGQ
jgi:hypothetical protein